ncbi:hypothetical protein ACJX0J_028009, partial [Zea mays]
LFYGLNLIYSSFQRKVYGVSKNETYGDSRHVYFPMEVLLNIIFSIWAFIWTFEIYLEQYPDIMQMNLISGVLDYLYSILWKEMCLHHIRTCQVFPHFHSSIVAFYFGLRLTTHKEEGAMWGNRNACIKLELDELAIAFKS